MRAGRLRHRVAIRRATTTQGSFGQPVEAWTDLASCWAEVRPLAGRELEHARQVHALASHRVLMRAVAAVTPADRLDWGGRTLEILEVRDTDVGGRTRQLMLTCRESV
ncbi:phage head closure protein [Tautonia plasticadhaerens]|uniref:Phage head-tail joining protein n=1 Tax=Tautonia plasticadhaerens TaxID=2527974 RepID=A0A518GZM2_9BACT|nr:phage head closure protein [Tautonia plasticadhaerens]QDV34021.1 Phage head-tail joining protein [Tautonia plasticadhaerens]